GHLTLWSTHQRAGRTLVDACDFVTDIGHHTGLGGRAELGFTGGGPEWLVTELGVFDFDADGHVRLRQLFPDVSLAEVEAATGFELRVGPDLRTVPPPSSAELAVLRAVDPLGVRRVEFDADELRRTYRHAETAGCRCRGATVTARHGGGQAEMVAVARRAGLRLVGPNCFGVQNCALPLNASLAAGSAPGGGGISLATQSGAYGMAIHGLGVDERTRFAKVYAAGNKADVGDAEVLAYLGDDPATRTVCCFLESLPDGRAFYEEARRVTPRKPVIVARTARSAAGARAARSHTASLAGREAVWTAAFTQAGIVQVRSGLEMMDAARALDAQPPP